jgi:uncharacterized membrane protein
MVINFVLLLKNNWRRTMAKTTTFAITHFSVAFGVTYALTGDIVMGGLIAIVEPAVNTVAYYFHEKIWNKVGGKNNIPLPQHC